MDRDPSEDSVLLTVSATTTNLPTHFERCRWPAHVTVLGNVVLAAPSIRSAETVFAEVTAEQAAFDVVLGVRSWFGPDRDVPVLLAEHDAFHRLHGRLVRAFDGIEARPIVPEHRGDGYRPHLSTATAGGVETGATFHVRRLSLVELDGARAHPLAAVRLG